MQALFPEGSLFTHALYGLTWCNYVHRLAIADPMRERAKREARWAMAQIGDRRTQRIFPELAEPRFGVFHCGWRNYR